MSKYDKSSVYVKRALQRGWLDGHKVTMDGTKVVQWVAYVEDVERWRKSCEMHKTPRDLTFAGSPKQLQAIQDWLSDPSTKDEDIASMRKSLEAHKVG